MKVNIDFKNKGLIIGLVTVLILIIIVLIIVFNGKEEPNNEPSEQQPTVVNITESANKQIKYTQYNNGDFSMKIPEGWMVETVKGINYAVRVYNPEEPMYQVFLFYTLGGFLKNKEAKQYYEVYSSISQTGFEKLPILNPGTPDNLYKIWTTVVGFVKTNMTGFANFNFPFFFNFKVKEQFELKSKLKEELTTKVDEAVLRASFTNDSGKNKGEGLFSVAIVDLNNSNTNLPYAVYNAVGITAPEEEFINWEPILYDCLKSIKFSDKYLNSVNNGISIDENTTININDELSAIITAFNASWNTRQTAEDITIQKELDNNLNYERVYNITTGEVYKVQKGWYNNYIGDTYKPATDEMYLQPISGYIK